MSEERSKTVLVTGDSLWDHNLVKDPSAPGRYDEPFDRTVLREVPDGAWFSSRLLGMPCREDETSGVGVGWALPTSRNPLWWAQPTLLSGAIFG